MGTVEFCKGPVKYLTLQTVVTFNVNTNKNSKQESYLGTRVDKNF